MLRRSLQYPASQVRALSSWSSKALSHKKTSAQCLLVDGNNLLYEMYDARCQLSWNGGPTGTAMRFVKCVYDLVRAKQPQRVGIFFDTATKTHRHLSNPNYKQSPTRKPMPDALRAQFDVTLHVLRALGLKVIQKPGVEADDFIASYTKICAADGYDVIVVSNDGDMHQLVQSPTLSPHAKQHVVIYKPTRGIYVAEKQVRKFLHGGAPSLHPGIRALCGDHWGKASGVPGGLPVPIAVSLLTEFGSLPRLLRSLNKVDDLNLRRRLQDAISALEVSYKMSKLQENVALPVAPAALDVLLPLTLDRSVLHDYLGPDGMATVLADPKNKRGKFNKRAHVFITPEPEETLDATTEAELDKWFDAVANGHDYK
ncbi:hypothetical protein SDRG_08583 [Saprolegnia diclina VS20]|uniref:5'-3' exonuclease domain-containing protein n=1 Tax=Saprolegnia diclina (strain VS20) TaxID=1156394 RepID=T0RNG4_SAPDV|nr:hypothetical protein SDRG_08583 [Saprolegnia diclina VS20]EQC33903.1 hypothetical protein SDRG_08583 [Saprolegnia diclina VS20]|eukprot:XP_008612698.1 hypothetical protein SDRG_08583 [Saprolegnia diclina VS20]